MSHKVKSLTLWSLHSNRDGNISEEHNVLRVTQSITFSVTCWKDSQDSGVVVVSTMYTSQNMQGKRHIGQSLENFSIAFQSSLFQGLACHRELASYNNEMQ